jgi:hypothetical protein
LPSMSVRAIARFTFIVFNFSAIYKIEIKSLLN